MIALHVTWGNYQSERWERLAEEQFQPIANESNDLSVDIANLAVPGGGAISVSATYSESNGGIGLLVNEGDVILVSVYCFRIHDYGFDPVVTFRMRGGTDVSLMVGPAS